MTQKKPAIYRFVVKPRQRRDPRSIGYLMDAHALGLDEVIDLICSDLYFIEGHLERDDLHRLATELLSDPIIQITEWACLEDSGMHLASDHSQIEVALRPGVTDPVAEQIVRASQNIGVNGVLRASTGFRFSIYGNKLREETLHLLARRLLANNVIQHYALGEIVPAFPEPATASRKVEVIPIRTMNSSELLACSSSRRAALDLNEMQAIQAYFRGEGRDCTDVEFETLAQTWSEHCVHKTFKARIILDTSTQQISPSLYPREINSLLNTYIKSATEEINAAWVLSAFSDNAGIIDFDDAHEVSFKVETHNHPSAIEPFGGANTGVGGVIRDVIGVSAKPIANTDILCFGPQDLPFDQLPEGVLHPRRIQSGVVSGVQDYGNKMGIPTVNGAIWYDTGFTANPLVFCGCVGIAPKGRHVRSPQPEDRVIVLGGRTGRDGLRGATFSSQTMDAQTGEVAGASVQIGDPITEKVVLEVILRARNEGLYHAITDCGAGGLSSAVGEMASRLGANIDLAQVKLKYPGLASWEIWLSEAQERMILAVPPHSLPRLQQICELFDTEMSDIGVFTGDGRLVVRYADQVVLNLDNEFLHNGLPQRTLNAAPSKLIKKITTSGEDILPDQVLLDLLHHPNIASKARIIHIYDHEVQGGTLIKPLTGRESDGPSDACVLKPIGTAGEAGIVLSTGLNPEYGKLDCYNMAISAVDEAVRNAVAVGADPDYIALLDNFCWGNPRRPEVMWSLLEAARGCHDAAVAHRSPFISGKDSLNNEYLTPEGLCESIPATLLISAIGRIGQVSKCVTLDLKEPGNELYLVGDFNPTLGGSHFELVTQQFSNQLPPCISRSAPQVYRKVYQSILAGWVQAAHDISEGGLTVAAAEMCIAGRLGLQLVLPGNDPILSLFGETNGCLLLEISAGQALLFEKNFAGLPYKKIGHITDAPALFIAHNGSVIITLSVDDLVKAWIR